MILLSMWWCISNDDCALDGFLSPVHVEADFESTLHVLGQVVTAISFDLFDEFLDFVNIIGERLHIKSFFVFDVSVSDERYATG